MVPWGREELDPIVYRPSPMIMRRQGGAGNASTHLRIYTFANENGDGYMGSGWYRPRIY